MSWLRIFGLFVLLLVSAVACEDDDGVSPPPASAGATGQAGAPATPASLELTPAKLSLAVGTSAEVKATLVDSEGTASDATSDASWTSSKPSVATVDGGTVVGVKKGSAEITVTASGVTATLTVTVTDATLVKLSITPPNPTLARGLEKQLTATGVFTDDTTQDLTRQVTWSSESKKVATVSASGLLTAVSLGSSKITAKVGASSATILANVSPATIDSIQLTPGLSIPKGLTQALTATATLSDGTTEDVTTQAEWTSSDDALAKVGASSGVVTAIALGEATITASLNGVAGSTKVTITSASLVAIGVTPATPMLAKGLTKQLTATGTYSDASVVDLTSQVTWQSSDDAIVAVSNAAVDRGLALTTGVGAASISATLDGVTGSTTVTVSAATVVSIGVTPATPSIAKGLSRQFTATGTYTDATTLDLTTNVTWASSDVTKASISNATGSRGLASTAGVGSTSISATLSGVTGSTTITVTAATLVSIGVTPATPSIAKGLSQQFTATGTYTDASTQDLTTAATWASSDPTSASISNASGSKGLASTAQVGSTSVSATLNGVTGSTTLTVSAAALVSIGVTPATPSIAKGLSQQFAATGTFTDASTQDLSGTVTWASADTAVASISNANGSRGLASTAGVGSTSISATLNGVIGSTTLTVTAATLVSIGVTPAAPSIAKGLTQQFTATGTFTDASTQNLTTTATWSAADPAKASISNASGSKGLATAASVGSTLISATLNGVIGSTTLTVSAATLVSIGVTPAAPSIAKGLSQQFTATGTYTDASTQTLTATATWASSDPSKASISNAAGSQGLASGAGVGSSTISATLSGVTGSTTLTVSAATLVSIAVTPAAPSVAKGLSQQFTAMGTYTDASTQDLSTTATWASSDPSKASISNAAGSKGLASTAALGSTSISATLSGVTGATTLTVSAATLVSIAVTPATPAIAKGLTQQFVATGTFTDSSTQTLTTTATWASSDTSKATISNAAGSQGLASSAGLGSTSISATLSGVTGSTSLTVTAATLVSIAVTPANTGIVANATQQFTATGTYTDATTQNLTTSVTWASSDAAAATISNAVGSIGLATSGSTLGLSTTISATFGVTVGSTSLYIGRHNILPWTGFATFNGSCNMIGSTGTALGNFEWLTIPSLTWKACLLEASKRGAQVLSPSSGPWPLPGWFANRAAVGNQVMLGAWNIYISDDLNNPHNCNLVRDRQSGATNNSPLANLITYDGDVWKYQDFGTMFIDQCEKLASAAGASIITPWTIGLPNGDNYWIGVLHTCSVYTWSTANGANFSFDNTVVRVSQKGCMLGYVL